MLSIENKENDLINDINDNMNPDLQGINYFNKSDIPDILMMVVRILTLILKQYEDYNKSSSLTEILLYFNILLSFLDLPMLDENVTNLDNTVLLVYQGLFDQLYSIAIRLGCNDCNNW